MSKINGNIKIISHEFILNRKDSICDAFIYNPVNIEESKLGSLFIVGEAFYADENRSKDIAYIINQTASHIKKEYYGSKKRSPHDSFEEAVKKANIFLAESAAEKKFFNVKNLNFIISSFSDQNFYFTACGTPKIFLLRGDNLMSIEKKLLLPEKTSPSKVFINIANGKLIKEDLLLLINSGFIDLFPQTTLKTIMLNNDFEASYEYISRTIKKDNDTLSCGMIMLNAVEEKIGPVVRYSYEELKKMSGNANESKSVNEITQEENYNEQADEKKRNSYFSAIYGILFKIAAKIYDYTKKISLFLFKWLRGKLLPYLKKAAIKIPVLKNPQIQKIIKNRIILIITFVTIVAIIVFIMYLFRKESTYLIK